MYNYEQSKTLHGPAGTTTHPLSCFVKLQVNHISLQIIQRYLQKHTTGIFRLWDKVRYVEYLVPITKPGQNITIFSFLNKSIIMYGCVSDDLNTNSFLANKNYSILTSHKFDIQILTVMF